MPEIRSSGSPCPADSAKLADHQSKGEAMQITGFPLFFLRAIKLTAACLVAALVAISHSTLAAQLSGQVLDPQGAAVVSAMVTLQHKKLNKTRTTYSAADGTYRLGITDDGLYDLRVRRIGFGESTESALPVVADSHLHLSLIHI